MKSKKRYRIQLLLPQPHIGATRILTVDLATNLPDTEDLTKDRGTLRSDIPSRSNEEREKLPDPTTFAPTAYWSHQQLNR